MTGTAPLIFDSLKLRPAIILIGVATLPMLPACTGNRKPTAENLVAETAEAKADLAKKALLDLARTDPQAFMDLDLDRIEKVPIERETTETFQWGAFVIDVRRLTFSADVPIATCVWFYNGEFDVDKTGRWTAKITNTTHAQEPPPDASQ